MTKCQHCHRPSQWYLCDNCSTQLENMLHEMQWLLNELDARIQKLDRIQIGTIGRNRRPAELTIIDFDAAEQARKIRKKLRRWVTTIAQRHNGRTPPALDTVATQALARWLETNVNAIARIDLAKKNRHPLYDDIASLVGTDQRGGQLVDAINRQDRRYLGPCTATIGKQRDGTPRQCGADLYAPTEAPTTTCPTCGTTTDTEQQLDDTIKERDLATEALLLERLAIMGEPVSHRQLYTWIKTGKLTPRGWIHDGRIVPHKIRHKDPRVFSLSQARQLRHKHSSAEVT